MFLVDTNILVYAANSDSDIHQRCRDLLIGWSRMPTPWYLTHGVVYEFLRVVSHPRILTRRWTAAKAFGFIRSLGAARSLGFLVETERHADVLEEIIQEVPDLSGNLVHDAHIVALMREHGIRTIYTRDTAFHRFRDIEVRDPLR